MNTSNAKIKFFVPSGKSGESTFFFCMAGLPALIMFIVTTISAIKSGIRIFYIGLPESPQII